MEGALAWIGQVAEWIGQFIPRVRVVRSTHKAVKFKRGHTVVVVDAGVRSYWPLVTDFLEYPVVRQAVELRAQTLVTVDDRSIVVGGMLVFEVSDLGRLASTTFDPDGTIKDISLTAVHDVCCRMDWTTLKNEQRRGTLDTKLKNAAQDLLRDYGVRVLKLMLTDLSPTRVFRLVQTTSKEG